MKGFAVIGSGFGDCAKGKQVDYLSAKYNEEAVVVRFNGGAQAGHTVVTPEGVRHVFHHFGSGSFNGSPTFLSKHFIVNPIIFRQEYEELVSKGVKPIVYVDPSCKVTTPYDMILNQMMEDMRGGNRHGSCGMGISETIERHDINGLIFNLTSEYEELKKIKQYAYKRIQKLEIQTIPDNYKSLMENENMINRYIKDLEFFKGIIILSSAKDISERYKNVIFEGAQGLLLDENNEFFPYVTRSKTGLNNIIELSVEMDIKEIEVTYVMRTYTTRHGNGPLPMELVDKPYCNIIDATNIPNQWQGTLRFSFLNLDLIRKAIRKDLFENNNKGVCIIHKVCMTCVDQLEDETIKYIDEGQIISQNVREFIKNKNIAMVSYGPTRNHVEVFNENCNNSYCSSFVNQ